jgi:DNA-binding LacI/PurR family transcriptional regulator
MRDQTDVAAGEAARGPAPRVTLREISEAAGVSISTASRALSGAGGISPAVRARVQAAAERLNYAGASASTITIVSNLNVMETGAGDFVQALMRGIEREARELGIGLSLSLLGPNPTATPESDSGSTGFLLLSMQDEGVIGRLHESGLPGVIVNGREPRMRLDAVAPANRMGGYLGAQHLIELGHRRILMLAYSPRPTIRDRLAGYRKAMREARIEEAEDLVVELSAMRTDVAYVAVKARLERPGGRDFTAIQCCNDVSAFGAMTALLEAGLRIPEDVSLMGFDDIPTAQMTTVPLTTIRVESEDLGASGVRRLVERIRTPGAPTTYTEYAVTLITRDSTAPARQP